MLKEKDINVFDASLRRLEFIFDNFQNIIIPISGGKDSAVVANLVLLFLKDKNIKNKIFLYHLDYEVQYSITTNFIKEIFKKFLYLKPKIFYICMPFKSQCSMSYEQIFFRPWEFEKESLWVRSLPKNTINIKNHKFDFWSDDLTDYDFNIELIKWINLNNKGSTIVLSGFRADECLYSCESIINDKNTFLNKQYLKKVESDLAQGYIIYDWSIEDIWVANSNLDFFYNKIYDYFFQLGVDIYNFKEASSFNNNVLPLLNLMRKIEPTLWEKVLKRVKGVYFTSKYFNKGAFYINEKDANIVFLNFLLNTLNISLKNNFLSKFKILQSKGIFSIHNACNTVLSYDFNKKYKEKVC